MTTTRRYELSNQEWERIKDYLPSDKLKNQGRPPKDNLLMLNAKVWIAKIRAPWRDLPESMVHGKLYTLNLKSGIKNMYSKKYLIF